MRSLLDTSTRAGIPFALALAIGGCGASEPLTCDPPIPPYALYVNVRDSASGRPLAVGTSGTADAPGIHDTLTTMPGDSLTLYSAHNAPGTYQVVLQRAGYRTWAAAGVSVVWGKCGGGNVAVSARLQPLGP